SDPERTLPQARDRRLPCRAPAPARGLPRPVLLPSAGSGYAGRGNRVGDGCADPPGQGAVLGNVGMAGSADPGGASGCPRIAPARADDGAAAVQPAAS